MVLLCPLPLSLHRFLSLVERGEACIDSALPLWEGEARIDSSPLVGEVRERGGSYVPPPLSPHQIPRPYGRLEPALMALRGEGWFSPAPPLPLQTPARP